MIPSAEVLNYDSRTDPCLGDFWPWLNWNKDRKHVREIAVQCWIGDGCDHVACALTIRPPKRFESWCSLVDLTGLKKAALWNFGIRRWSVAEHFSWRPASWWRMSDLSAEGRYVIDLTTKRNSYAAWMQERGQSGIMHITTCPIWQR